MLTEDELLLQLVHKAPAIDENKDVSLHQYEVPGRRVMVKPKRNPAAFE